MSEPEVTLEPSDTHPWPFPPEEKKLPVVMGYRALTHTEIDLINQAKQLGQSLGGVIEALRLHPDFDQRWIAIGETHLQQGIMALTRAIARPTSF